MSTTYLHILSFVPVNFARCNLVFGQSHSFYRDCRYVHLIRQGIATHIATTQTDAVNLNASRCYRIVTVKFHGDARGTYDEPHHVVSAVAAPLTDF